ncbi:hypothetical protein SAMN05216304_109212 [Bosea sp. OK403]|uniref:hypothetical protein n=1 Tax=Bosea sp. OK403 TaxID=1855286 RepID=UPI0008E1A26C|nr:hypothetical protein [Bosea sp. OK403]SFJ56524.1 hypothetical protein SAMN05216304_109212 [Bosea sp. OK403]
MKEALGAVRIRRLRQALTAMAGFAALGLATLALWGSDAPVDHSPPTTIALGILGDSSSHSYQDSLSFPPGSADRGGALRPHTFQWTEVLALLRGNELNLGPWVRWGQPSRVAWLRSLIGLQVGRTPKKEDYLYNFANSGANCNDLMGAPQHRLGQARNLVKLMDRDPERWRNGVTVIRIVNNDWEAVLDDQVRDPRAPAVRAVAAHCVEQIAAAISLIHAAHPLTRILLVGAGNEADDPSAFDKYRSPVAVANIQAALGDFNAQLRELAGGDERIAFFDVAAWFGSLWGTRPPDGTPAYRAIAVGETLRVTNTMGDEPNNAILADDHGGLVCNALWAQSLVLRLREAFDLPLTPISDEDIVRFVAPLATKTVATDSRRTERQAD